MTWPEDTGFVLLQTFWLSQYLRRWDELRLHLWFLGYEYPLEQIRDTWCRVLQSRQIRFLATAGKVVADPDLEIVEDRSSAVEALAVERAGRMRREGLNLWKEDRFPEALAILLRRAFVPEDAFAWTLEAEWSSENALTACAPRQGIADADRRSKRCPGTEKDR